MTLVTERFQMTGRHWLKLFGFCLVFNVATLSLPIAALMFLISPAASAAVPFIGLLLGIPIALVPTGMTILLALLVSRVLGYFSFGQFFTIGAVVSCGLAWREIGRDNVNVRDYLLVLVLVLPGVWWLGWLAAQRWRVLPEPTTSSPAERPAWIEWTLRLVSLGLIGATVIGAFAASHDFKLRRAAEWRGVCPEERTCTTWAPGANYEPRTTIHVARMAGQQFVVPANSLGGYLRNDDKTPGEVGFIEIEGVLPDFDPLSTDNLQLFRSRESIGTATLRPICHDDVACPDTANPLKRAARMLNGKMPDLVAGAGLPTPPADFEYMGDFWRHDGFGPTTPENANYHLYRRPDRDAFIVCDREGMSLMAFCEHAFFWREFEVVLFFRAGWVTQWRDIEAAIITRLEGFTAEQAAPVGASYIADRLPKRK